MQGKGRFAEHNCRSTIYDKSASVRTLVNIFSSLTACLLNSTFTPLEAKSIPRMNDYGDGITQRVDSTQTSVHEEHEGQPKVSRKTDLNVTNPACASIDFISHRLPKTSIPTSIDETDVAPLQLPCRRLLSSAAGPSQDMDLETLAMDHYHAFKMPVDTPTAKQLQWTPKLAYKQIRIVSSAFPAVRDKTSVLAMCAWFHLFCFFDDETEKMPDREGKRAIGLCIDILEASCLPNARFSRTLRPLQKAKIRYTLWSSSRLPSGGTIAGATFFFTQHTRKLLAPAVYKRMVTVIVGVFQAYAHEITTRAKVDSLSLDEYLISRSSTIGLAPFWEIALDFFSRRECSVAGVETLKQVQSILQPHVATVVGLQNDLVGLQKDLAESDRMNYVVLRAERTVVSIEQALSATIVLHNSFVREAVQGRQILEQELARHGKWDDGVEIFADCMVGFMETHFAWASNSKRYKMS
jgi:hypothetical protein